MPVKTEPEITPLYREPRYEQIAARAEALQQRLEVVKAETRKPRPDPLADWVTQLTNDPTAPLALPTPTGDQSRQLAALEQAITAVEAEGQRLRAELSRDLAGRMRPGRAARARDLAAALERALEAMQEDVAAHRTVLDAGYEPPGMLLTVADRDALTRMLERVRA